MLRTSNHALTFLTFRTFLGNLITSAVSWRRTPKAHGVSQNRKFADNSYRMFILAAQCQDFAFSRIFALVPRVAAPDEPIHWRSRGWGAANSRSGCDSAWKPDSDVILLQRFYWLTLEAHLLWTNHRSSFGYLRDSTSNVKRRHDFLSPCCHLCAFAWINLVVLKSFHHEVSVTREFPN